jgi:GDP-D-mannose dehydratase
MEKDKGLAEKQMKKGEVGKQGKVRQRRGIEVCVTGVTGFVAGHVVEEFLRKGYDVRGTVRGSAVGGRTKHLVEMGERYRHLNGVSFELVEADLLKEGSFDKAFEGTSETVNLFFSFVGLVAQQGNKLVIQCVAMLASVKLKVLCRMCGSDTHGVSGCLESDHGPVQGAHRPSQEGNPQRPSLLCCTLIAKVQVVSETLRQC